MQPNFVLQLLVYLLLHLHRGLCPCSKAVIPERSILNFRLIWSVENYIVMAGIGSRMNLPGPLRMIGKKHIEQAGQWIPTGMAYGTTAFGLLLYFTDWKVVLQYLPYYNIAFKKEEDEK